MKVMLVDDSQTIRKLERNVLAELGHTDIIEIDDGAQALDRLASATVDLVLADWHMPGMDGLTFVRRLRGTGDLTPVIMCITEAQKDRVVQAIKAGVTNYIVKPFGVDTLAEKIQQAMARVTAPAGG